MCDSTLLTDIRQLILEMGSVIRLQDEDSEHSEFWNNDGDYLIDGRFQRLEQAIADLNGKGSNNETEAQHAPTLQISTSIMGYVDVFATYEHGDYPPFARFEIDQAFIDRLYQAKERCKDGVSSISIGDAPDEWWNAEQFRIRGENLVVSEIGFFFSAYPKHANYELETRYIYFNDFERIIKDAIDNRSTELFFNNITEEQVLEYKQAMVIDS